MRAEPGALRLVFTFVSIACDPAGHAGPCPEAASPQRAVFRARGALSCPVVRWLSLDVGSRRVGLAICDAGERVVTPLQAIPYGGPEALAVAIAKLVEARDIGGVAVGLPVTRGGGGRGETRVAQVAAALGRRLAVPVELIDERGSTKEAETLLAEAGAPRRRWPELVDSVAARLILERHLARRSKPGRSQDVDQGGNEC